MSNPLADISTREIKELLDGIPDEQSLRCGFAVGHVRKLISDVELLTKERDEWKGDLDNQECDTHFWKERAKKLEAENAELKEENGRLHDQVPKLIADKSSLKSQLTESQEKVKELGLWNRRAEFLRRLYTEAAKDGSLTWDKIDKVMAEDN